MSEKKSISSFKIWAIGLITSILLLAMGGLGGVLWQKYEDRPRYLEYRIDRIDGMIPNPETGEDKFGVLVGMRRVENLSNLTVTILNNEDKDFEAAELICTINGNPDDYLILINDRITAGNQKTKLISSSLNVLSEAAITQGDHDYGFTKQDRLDSLKQSENDEPIEFKYELSAINRSDPIAFQVEYLFEGEKAPDIQIDLVATSLGIREQAKPNSNRVIVPKWSVYLFFVMGLALLFGLIAALAEILGSLYLKFNKPKASSGGDKPKEDQPQAN